LGLSKFLGSDFSETQINGLVDIVWNIKNQELDSYRPSLVQKYFPEAIELYQQLEENSWQPNNGQSVAVEGMG
jgi:hypothetical protein